MEKFICTFGWGQVLQGKHIVIYANTRQEATDYINKTYGGRYAFLYTDEEWQENLELAETRGIELEEKYAEVIV